MNNDVITINTKEKFIENVKKWVYIDNQIRDLQNKVKKYREYKTKITPYICQYIENNISSNKIDITDGELKLYEKKDYSPLTFTYIENALKDLNIDDKYIEIIIQKLKDNREITSYFDIRRIHKNKLS